MIPLTAAIRNFRQAAALLGVDSKIQKSLLIPYRVIKVECSIAMDGGTLGSYVGFRVQHDNARGPMKGGIRYHPEVDMEEVNALAQLMTWKTGIEIRNRSGQPSGCVRHFAGEGGCNTEDIYANSRGVFVSYFEWVQNIQCFTWCEKRVNAESCMRKAFDDIKRGCRSYHCSIRMGAFTVGVSRVAYATTLRGWGAEHKETEPPPVDDGTYDPSLFL